VEESNVGLGHGVDILDADLYSFVGAKQRDKSQEKLVKDDSNNEGSSHEHGDTEESNGVGNASIMFNRISNYNLASVALMSVLVCFHRMVNSWLRSFLVFSTTKKSPMAD